MKSILTTLLFFFCVSLHATTLECGPGWQWLSFAGIDELQQNGDQVITAGCRWQSSLYPSRRHWLPALPDARYVRGLPTRVSDSRGYIRYHAWQLQLPLYRMQQVVLSAYAASDYRQQRQQLTDDLLWRSSTLPTGQTLIMDSQRRELGITLDMRALEAPLTAIWLRYREQRTPLSLTREQQDVLTRAELQSWRLGIERDTQGNGLQPVGHLAIGQGQALDDDSTAVLAQAGNNNDFIVIDMALGLQWYHRAGQHLQYYLAARAELEYLQFPDAGRTDSVDMHSISSLDYGVRGGLSWRF